MSWTYLQFDSEWEPLPDSPSLPGPKTAYLGFDALRGCVVLGYTERGGYHSFLGPNVDDDCRIVAFAPLSETTEPDLQTIKRLTPFVGRPPYADYIRGPRVNLLR
jgi:hypothetical protein